MKFNQRSRREVLAGEDWLLDLGTTLFADEQHRDAALIIECVETLPSPYRDVVEMRFYGRLQLDEIAEYMGWPDRRFTSVYIGRAVEMLRKVLNERGYNPE